LDVGLCGPEEKDEKHVKYGFHHSGVDLTKVKNITLVLILRNWIFLLQKKEKNLGHDILNHIVIFPAQMITIWYLKGLQVTRLIDLYIPNLIKAT
jgi:hypothetical protein